MTWDELDPAVRKTINENLTTLQAQAYVLALYGMNERQIGRCMDVTPATVRGHLEAAGRNLRRAGVHFHPDGTPYLKETA